MCATLPMLFSDSSVCQLRLVKRMSRGCMPRALMRGSGGAFYASHYYQTLNGRETRHSLTGFMMPSETSARRVFAARLECVRVKWVRSGKQN